MNASATGPLEALDAFVEVLADAEEGTSRDAFYGRLCDAVCRLTSVDRAVIFRYDEAQRRVRAAGVHNLDLAFFEDRYVNVESAPIAKRALEADAVIESESPFTNDLPAEYLPLLGGGSVVCVPIAAGRRWIGVVVGERGESGALAPGERHLLWTLGKIAGLAAIARIATFDHEHARQLQQRIDTAREIHDGVVQQLFGLKLALETPGPVPDDERERASHEVQKALDALKGVLERPLGRTARATHTTLADELERLANEHPEIEFGGELGEVPAVYEPLAQSVLLEAARNALKHARPTAIAVKSAVVGDAFVLEIRNDGVLAGADRSPGTGMGLRLTAFEALQAGGLVEFGAREPGTWQVSLVVPLDADD